MMKFFKYILIANFIILNSFNVLLAENDFTGKVLYVEKEDVGSTYLSIMDNDGNNSNRLTPSLFYIVAPRYNKVINKIGFTSYSENMESEIFLYNFENGETEKIITKAIFQDFSPDGKYILFTTKNETSSLYMYNIAKKQKTKISRSLNVSSANWSNDGMWIIVSAYTENNTLDLYIISCYGKGIIRITDTPEVNEAYPTYANDNNKFVYYTNRYGEKNEIEILGAGENGGMALVRPYLPGIYPSFSPDGREIVYQDGDDIMISDIEGSEPKKIGTGSYPYWIK